MYGGAREVAVTVAARSIYVKLTICTVTRRIHRNTSTNPIPKPKPISNPHTIRPSRQLWLGTVENHGKKMIKKHGTLF